jgi:hypothetical protein
MHFRIDLETTHMNRLLTGLAIVAAFSTPAFAAGAHHVALATSDGPCGFLVTGAAHSQSQTDACLTHILAMKAQHPTAVVINMGGTGGGPSGPQGVAGLNGTNGVNGTNGTNGVDGAQGPKGDTGATGPTGPQGDPGPVGPTGATGADGAPGPQAVVPGPAGRSGADWSAGRPWSAG